MNYKIGPMKLKFHMSEREFYVQDAFNQLIYAVQNAIPGTFVDDQGQPTDVNIEEFMLMSGKIDHSVLNDKNLGDPTGEVFSFKHYVTRNYLQVIPRRAGPPIIEIPRTEEPFMKGTF